MVQTTRFIGGVMGMKILKRIAKERLYGKIERDKRRAERFEMAVGEGWTAEKGNMWVVEDDGFEETSFEVGSRLIS